MTYASKDLDWEYIDDMIEKEIKANEKYIPKKHLENGIYHYFDHGEPAMAFEYLYLEIMERERYGKTHCSIGKDKAKEIALMLDLDKEHWIEKDFWLKFSNWLEGKICVLPNWVTPVILS